MRVSAPGKARPQDLIHTNKVPNPALARPTAVSYSLEWGVSEAVVSAAFIIAIKLAEGGYATR
jgi:hypothetical protein